MKYLYIIKSKLVEMIKFKNTDCKQQSNVANYFKKTNR